MAAISPYYWFRSDGGGRRAWGGGEIGAQRTGEGRDGRMAGALGVRFFPVGVRHWVEEENGEGINIRLIGRA